MSHWKIISFLFLGALFTVPINPPVSHAQVVEDGSDAAIGKDDTRMVLDLIGQHLDKSLDPKVTSLRRSKGRIVCGSVNVKNKQGLYLGERGFVVDLAQPSFGRLPEGPELMNPRAEGFAAKERIRQLYFEMCLD